MRVGRPRSQVIPSRWFQRTRECGGRMLPLAQANATPAISMKE